MVFGVVGSDAPKTVHMLMASSAEKDRESATEWVKEMVEVLVGMFEGAKGEPAAARAAAAQPVP